jgi:hypothetical protein
VATRGCRVFALCLLASGTAGCLLFTDPINTAPVVEISPGGSEVPKFVRSKEAEFMAIASDPDQGADSLTFDWYRAKTCDRVLDGLPTNATPGMTFQPAELGPGCVGVKVTDKHGATASATQRYDVVDLAPVAVLRISPAAGQPTPIAGQPYAIALFSEITLSGSESYDPDDDKPTPIWHVYSADDKEVLVPGCPDNSKGPYVCTFTTATPGTYSVQLTVNNGDLKNVAEQFIQVAEDQLPNIVLDSAQPLPPTSPNDPPLLLFADLANTFTINRVEDDGDPYPRTNPLDPNATSPAGFVWFWRYYPTDASFQRVILSGPTFTIPAKLDLAQPTIQVRVEYHDRVTACQPRTSGCDAAFAACDVNATICYGPNRRIQWVTWTVTFR